MRAAVVLVAAALVLAAGLSSAAEMGAPPAAKVASAPIRARGAAEMQFRSTVQQDAQPAAAAGAQRSTYCSVRAPGPP